MIITSTDNKIFKQIKSLHMKKFRDRDGLFLTENPKLVREAIELEAAEVIVTREDYEGDEIKKYSDMGNAKFVFMEGKLFDKIAQTENASGILAVCKKPDEKREAFVRSGSRIVVLDRLQDPGNIGTIIRTAEAAGFDGVMAVKGTGDIFSAKVVRAAAGSVLRLPFMNVESPGEAIDFLAKSGKTIVTTSPAGNPDAMIPDRDVAIVIGNEGNGADEEFISSADLNKKIPMSGKVESLNAAVAAALLMYEIRN